MPTAELELPRLDDRSNGSLPVIRPGADPSAGDKSPAEQHQAEQPGNNRPTGSPSPARPVADPAHGSPSAARAVPDPTPGSPSAARADEEALAVASVRVLVVDDHAPSRVGLAALLSRQAWVERCFLAAGSEESVALTHRHRPDVVILDVSQTGPFAGSVTSAIREAHPGVQILLTSRCRTSAGAPPTSLGAVGFLPAGVSGADVVDAVRAAVLFGEPLEPTIVATPAGPELSEREREILVLLGTGLTNREIGERLHLGPDSVKKTATGLYRKLGVRNRTEAARRAATILAA